MKFFKKNRERIEIIKNYSLMAIAVTIFSVFYFRSLTESFTNLFSPNPPTVETSKPPSAPSPRKNIATATLVNTISEGGWYYALGITPDGKTLISGSCDGTIKTWNLQTGELKSTLPGHHQRRDSSCTWSIAISPDSKTLFSIGDGSNINILNLQTGEVESTLYTHPSVVFSLALSPDGNTLVSGDFGNINIWRLSSQQ